MATYKVTTTDSKEEHFIEADYYQSAVNNYLELYKRPNHAANENSTEIVATFHSWICVEKVDASSTSLQDEIKKLEEEKTVLMREHHQLLEMSVSDLATLKQLKSENEDLYSKIEKLKNVVA